MHYTETNLTSNTVQLARASLPSQSETYYYGLKEKPIQDLFSFQKNHTPIFLFPDENATFITYDEMKKIVGPIELIIPDGTWSKAKKIKRRTHFFKTLKSFTLIPGPPSTYRLRTQKQAHHLSTFEAMARAIKEIEGEKSYASLMNNFDLMVEATLKSRRGGVFS